MKYSVLIADDEPHARAYLEKLIQTRGELELIGTCPSGRKVLEFCKTLMPDIVLLDIEMPGLNGIETARKLGQYDSPPMIVFSTAYDQYAIEAFEVEAIAYLLKPFSEEDFSRVIERVLKQCEQSLKLKFNERLEQLFERFKSQKSSYLQQFEIKERGLLRKIDSQSIYYIQSDSEYARLYTDKSFHMYRTSLELLDQQMPPSFLRVHRSYLVNLKHIKEWKYLNNGTYAFTFTNGAEVKSSRSYQSRIQAALDTADFQ